MVEEEGGGVVVPVGGSGMGGGEMGAWRLIVLFVDDKHCLQDFVALFGCCMFSVYIVSNLQYTMMELTYIMLGNVP